LSWPRGYQHALNEPLQRRQLHPIAWGDLVHRDDRLVAPEAGHQLRHEGRQVGLLASAGLIVGGERSGMPPGKILSALQTGDYALYTSTLLPSTVAPRTASAEIVCLTSGTSYERDRRRLHAFVRCGPAVCLTPMPI